MAMKLYKLTDSNDRTYGDCQWGTGVCHKTSGKGELCGEGFTHWYTDPLLAILLNPIHAHFDLTKAHLWEGIGVVAKEDRGLKVGCRTAATVKRIELPYLSLDVVVVFSILCAIRAGHHSTSWLLWAYSWLQGINRQRSAAEAAYAAAAAKAAYAAKTAAYAAKTAAKAAAAAEAAPYTAHLYLDDTFYAAAKTAEAASGAAEAATVNLAKLAYIALALSV